VEPKENRFLPWLPINYVEACFAVPSYRATKLDANLIYQVIGSFGL
jgi:hypothetical protein